MMDWTPQCYIPGFVGIGPSVLEKKIFFLIFTIYGHGGHLGHVTWLRNRLKQIFRCALALLKFVFKNETGLGVSLEPCQFS